MAIKRLTKPSVRELFANKHVSLDIENQGVRLCACIVMEDHLESETIYG